MVFSFWLTAMPQPSGEPPNAVSEAKVRDGRSVMDIELLSDTVRHHGNALLERLVAEQVNLGGAFVHLSGLVGSCKTNTQSAKDDAFGQKLMKFIARKSDLLFSAPTVAYTKDGRTNAPTNVSEEGRYVVTPPIEYFMEVPRAESREHFFKSLVKGSILIGSVAAIQDAGLQVSVLATDCRPHRYIEHLGIAAFCPLRELKKAPSHEDQLEEFVIKDIVRVAVVALPADNKPLVVSMLERNLPPSSNSRLGHISDEKLPLHYRCQSRAEGMSYGEYLEEQLEFNNPRCVANLAEQLLGGSGDSMPPSLMRGLARVTYNEVDYADKLKKAQTYRLAMRSVEQGVSEFKEGRPVEAMQLLNRALQIDATNVEALVARGALYANSESYSRAMEDFEAALAVDATHDNARSYMLRTLIAHARSLLEAGSVDEAEGCVERATRIDPCDPDISDVLDRINAARELADRKVSGVMICDDDGDDDGGYGDGGTSTIERAKRRLLKSLLKDKSTKHSGSSSTSSSSSDSDSPRHGHSARRSRTTIISSTARRKSSNYDARLINPEQGSGAMSQLGPDEYGPSLPPPRKVVVTISKRKSSKKKRKIKRSSSSSSSISDRRKSSTSPGPSVDRKKSSESISPKRRNASTTVRSQLDIPPKHGRSSDSSPFNDHGKPLAISRSVSRDKNPKPVKLTGSDGQKKLIQRKANSPISKKRERIISLSSESIAERKRKKTSANADGKNSKAIIIRDEGSSGNPRRVNENANRGRLGRNSGSGCTEGSEGYGRGNSARQNDGARGSGYKENNDRRSFGDDRGDRRVSDGKMDSGGRDGGRGGLYGRPFQSGGIRPYYGSRAEVDRRHSIGDCGGVGRGFERGGGVGSGFERGRGGGGVARGTIDKLKYSSSSSESESHRGKVADSKSNAMDGKEKKSVKKEEKKEETLEDMEQFLKELKAAAKLKAAGSAKTK